MKRTDHGMASPEMSTETGLSSSNPHILLMHGAGLGRWIWDRVIPELPASTEAVDLPGRSDGRNPGDVTLAECIDFIAEKAQPPAILVGHSFSAEIALGVAAAHPQRVAAVILVGGLVPESGKSFMTLLPLPQRLFLHVLLRLSRRGVKLPASLVKSEYCDDLDEQTTELVLAKTTPEAPRLYLDALDWSALPESMPRFYIKLLDDRSLDLKQQERIIERIRATDVRSMQTGHLPMLASPHEMAKTLNRLIETIYEAVKR